MTRKTPKTRPEKTPDKRNRLTAQATILYNYPLPDIGGGYLRPFSAPNFGGAPEGARLGAGDERKCFFKSTTAVHAPLVE